MSDDTSPEMEALYREKLLGLTGERRFMMGVSMFDTARSMVEASLPLSLSRAEYRTALLTRFYGDELGAEVIFQIARC